MTFKLKTGRDTFSEEKRFTNTLDSEITQQIQINNPDLVGNALNLIWSEGGEQFQPPMLFIPGTDESFSEIEDPLFSRGYASVVNTSSALTILPPTYLDAGNVRIGGNLGIQLLLSYVRRFMQSNSINLLGPVLIGWGKGGSEAIEEFSKNPSQYTALILGDAFFSREAAFISSLLSSKPNLAKRIHCFESLSNIGRTNVDTVKPLLGENYKTIIGSYYDLPAKMTKKAISLRT